MPGVTFGGEFVRLALRMSLLSRRTTERALAWFRFARRQRPKWSGATDREFHDALFEVSNGHTHDPYRSSYPGSITVRRFADAADERVAASATVLDLGCGPAEITCELARRHERVRFHGVDHSPVAIARASATAGRLGLRNATFEVADVERYVPGAVDLVTMFDSFHHLLDPAGFVRRFSQHAARFLLIEPAGDALGRWRRTLDFDWVPSELDKIRARAEHALGLPVVRQQIAGHPDPDAAGTAVENRYPLSDYEAFFSGYALDVRGTTAGLDVYPPNAALHTELRAELMDAACRLFAHIDRALYETGRDLEAKHWIIYATREPGFVASRRRPQPVEELPAGETVHVQGPWDARYADVVVAATMPADADVLIELTVCNDSWRPWRSDSAAPINLSYHWIDARGEAVVQDGLRSRLPRTLEAGTSLRLCMTIRTPAASGRYELQIDLVEEGVTWFSRAGIPPFRASVRVAGRGHSAAGA